MKIKSIELDKIKRIDNYRTTKGDLAELMSSIKENDLLQPVGVKMVKEGKYQLLFGNRRYEAFMKLGRKTIPCSIVEDSKNDVIINLIENVQRRDTTLFEVGRAINSLKDEGLSNSEIVARIGVSKTFIKNSFNIFKMTPKKFRSKVVNMDNIQKSSKKGLIAATVASVINNTANRYKLKKKEVEEFYAYASKNELSAQGTSVIIKLMGEGLCLKDALASKDKVKSFRASVVMRQDEYDRLVNKYGRDFISHIVYNQDYDKIKKISRILKVKR